MIKHLAECHCWRSSWNASSLATWRSSLEEIHTCPNSIFAREEAFQFHLQQWHSAKSSVNLFRVLYSSVAELKANVKGKRTLFCLVNKKTEKPSFLTSCVFLFVFWNAGSSSHFRFRLFGLRHSGSLAARVDGCCAHGISIIRGHIWLWRFDDNSSESVFFALAAMHFCSRKPVQ